MTHLVLMLLALQAPLRPEVVRPRFVSHAGPSIHLAQGIQDLGLGLGLTLSRPLMVNGAEAALLGGAGIATFAMLPFDQRVYASIHRNIQLNIRGQSVFDYTLWLGEGWVDLLLVWGFSVGDARARRVALEGTEALLSVAVVSTVCKRLLRVPRPDDTHGPKRYFQRFQFIDNQNDSLPSGHTMSAFATATVLASEYPQSAPFGYAAATLVALSVIEHGWHWPSDIIAGAALGVVIGRGAVLANEHVTLGPGPGLGLSAATRF